MTEDRLTHLDAEGRAGEGLVEDVLSLVSSLAEGVREAPGGSG